MAEIVSRFVKLVTKPFAASQVVSQVHALEKGEIGEMVGDLELRITLFSSFPLEKEEDKLLALGCGLVVDGSLT